MDINEDLIFATETPLGFRVRVTRVRWELIVSEKHPVMKGREAEVRAALESPDEVRQSRTDQQGRASQTVGLCRGKEVG